MRNEIEGFVKEEMKRKEFLPRLPQIMYNMQWNIQNLILIAFSS
jgi:hypothetical protein